MTRKLLIAAAVALLPHAAVADTADRLLQLISIPGVAGYEANVREAIEMLLPPGARVEVFEDTGHFIHIEQPQRVAALVTEFLA